MTYSDTYFAALGGFMLAVAIVATIATGVAVVIFIGKLIVGIIAKAYYDRWAATQAVAREPVKIYTEPSARVRTKNYECPTCGTNDPNAYIR